MSDYLEGILYGPQTPGINPNASIPRAGIPTGPSPMVSTDEPQSLEEVRAAIEGFLGMDFEKAAEERARKNKKRYTMESLPDLYRSIVGAHGPWGRPEYLKADPSIKNRARREVMEEYQLKAPHLQRALGGLQVYEAKKDAAESRERAEFHKAETAYRAKQAELVSKGLISTNQLAQKDRELKAKQTLWDAQGLSYKARAERLEAETQNLKDYGTAEPTKGSPLAPGMFLGNLSDEGASKAKGGMVDISLSSKAADILGLRGKGGQPSTRVTTGTRWFKTEGPWGEGYIPQPTTSTSQTIPGGGISPVNLSLGRDNLLRALGVSSTEKDSGQQLFDKTAEKLQNIGAPTAKPKVAPVVPAVGGVSAAPGAISQSLTKKPDILWDLREQPPPGTLLTKEPDLSEEKKLRHYSLGTQMQAISNLSKISPKQLEPYVGYIGGKVYSLAELSGRDIPPEIVAFRSAVQENISNTIREYSGKAATDNERILLARVEGDFDKSSIKTLVPLFFRRTLLKNLLAYLYLTPNPLKEGKLVDVLAAVENRLPEWADRLEENWKAGKPLSLTQFDPKIWAALELQNLVKGK